MCKATNLYRRVSTTSYKDTRSGRLGKPGHKKHNSNDSKCLVCRVTLVKSSKDRHRAGVKLRCPCNVRVCSMCLGGNPTWYLSQPHFTSCEVMSRFVCGICSTFQDAVEKVCCLWLCAGCSAGRSAGEPCVKCSRETTRGKRREMCTLWPKTRSAADCPADDTRRVCDVSKVDRYRQEIRHRVLRKVSQSRHISPSDIKVLFHDTHAASEPCACDSTQGSALCTSCTPVLTIMELLAKNPKPLMASLAERAIPGRALVRHTYNRDLLLQMLNDQRLPFCSNAHNCKGMLVSAADGKRRPLRALISPQAYADVARCDNDTANTYGASPTACILCLLFNQSSSVSRMLSSESLYLEPPPAGPVYYFNIKLSPDVGIPQVDIGEYHNYTVCFKGTACCFKPTFYYNWRDVLAALRIDNVGKVTLLPVC